VVAARRRYAQPGEHNGGSLVHATTILIPTVRETRSHVGSAVLARSTDESAGRVSALCRHDRPPWSHTGTASPSCTPHQARPGAGTGGRMASRSDPERERQRGFLKILSLIRSSFSSVRPDAPSMVGRASSDEAKSHVGSAVTLGPRDPIPRGIRRSGVLDRRGAHPRVKMRCRKSSASPLRTRSTANGAPSTRTCRAVDANTPRCRPAARAMRSAMHLARASTAAGTLVT
jgi:hypothetical protein